MASYDKYDARLDSLVMETKTFWDPEIGDVSDEDKEWLAIAVHQKPEEATTVHYERSHTGFTREITVTVEDIERVYDEKVSG